MADDQYSDQRECRCCRKPVPNEQLACYAHWIMLPVPLRLEIKRTYKARKWREFAVEVGKADEFWKARGIWKPGVPKSTSTS